MKLGLQPDTGARSRRRITRNSSPPPRRPASTRCSPPRRGVRTRSPRWPGGAAKPGGCGWAPGGATIGAHPDRVRDGLADDRPSPVAGTSSAWVFRAAGGRRLVRAALPATGAHPGVHRHRAQGLGPRGPGDQRRTALPAAPDRGGHHRTGQTALPIVHRCAPTSRSCWAPKAQRTSRWLPRSATAGCPSSTPAHRRDVQRVARRGFRPPGARRSREDFEICATAQLIVTDDRPAVMELMKPHLALYMGGMGPRIRISTPTSTAGWVTPRWSRT